MPLPSSNISSTLKTKGSLRAPSNDLPPVDLISKSTEIVRIQGKNEIESIESKIPSSPPPLLLPEETQIHPSLIEELKVRLTSLPNRIACLRLFTSTK